MARSKRVSAKRPAPAVALPNTERTGEAPHLSIADTQKKLQILRQAINDDTIAKTVNDLREGKPDEFAIRRLLAEFVRRAVNVREHLGGEYTADLTEFVASRLDVFLRGTETDLMKAFGLTMPRRGRRRSESVRLRQEAVAAEVMDTMRNGSTLDQACELVAPNYNIHESTARNWYVEHQRAAENLLLYRHTLHPSFGDSEE